MSLIPSTKCIDRVLHHRKRHILALQPGDPPFIRLAVHCVEDKPRGIDAQYRFPVSKPPGLSPSLSVMIRRMEARGIDSLVPAIVQVDDAFIVTGNHGSDVVFTVLVDGCQVRSVDM